MYRKLELAFLRLEHQAIRFLRLNRMSHNLIWLALGLLTFVGFLSAWLLSLHPRPDTEFISIRDPFITSGHAEVYYKEGSFYLQPLKGKVFFNNQEVDHTAPLKEGDQFILGHTILQLVDTTGWLPKLKTVGYYLDDQILRLEKISMGRSDRAEEENNWEPNQIVVSDTTFEPVQLWIYPEKDFNFSIENRGKKSIEIAQSGAQDWSPIWNKRSLKMGDKIRVGESILQFTKSRTGKGAELQILQGRAPTYRLYLDKRSILSGSHMIPGGYIPDTLVDEEFLENVRRCIEARLIYLVQEEEGGRVGERKSESVSHSSIRVKGFTRTGKLIETQFNSLTKREQRLLEGVFRFSVSEGSQLKWRRPFNRTREDPYLFDGTELENFIIKDGELKGIYNFAARLVSPYALQKELSIERGSIYDRDRETLPRLVLSNPEAIKPEPDLAKPQTKSARLAPPVKGPVQFLLVDHEDPTTVVELSLNKPLESKIYIASGYVFVPSKVQRGGIEGTSSLQAPASKLQPTGRVIIKRLANHVRLAQNCSPVKPSEAGAKLTLPLEVPQALPVQPEFMAFDHSSIARLLPNYACVEEKELVDGEMFEIGDLNFIYHGAGSGLLAGNKEASTERYYPLGEKLAHIIGYNYPRGSFKRNLEEIFDNILLGKERASPWYHFASMVESRKGNNLILTLDDDLQQIIYEALKKKLDELNQNSEDKGQKAREPEMKDEGPDVESDEYSKINVFRGAAIAINSEGEILASVTLPTYNPHDVRSVLAALKESSLDHWNSSFINRAFQKTYPPGSTFKLIMSSLALENKDQFLREDRNYLIKDGPGGFFCTGILGGFEGRRLGYPIRDFRWGRHGGPLTLEKALAESCNNAFAFLALKAGRELITEHAERYGFNQLDDLLPMSVFEGDLKIIGLINRSEGDALFTLKSRVPIPEQELHISKVARMGIGQWDIEVTPLEMALIAMTIGNSGLQPYPHLVKGIEEGETNQITYFRYPEKKQVLSPATANTLKTMMQKVIQEGTAIRLSMSKVPYYSLKEHVAGKTGTAEVQGEDGKKSNIAWFVSVAPVEDPKLAIAIVIEKGAIISREPVMVARDIWEKTVLLYHDQFLRPELLNSPDHSESAKSQGSVDLQKRKVPKSLRR